MPLVAAGALAWLALYANEERLARGGDPGDLSGVRAYDRVAVPLAWKYGQRLANVALTASLALTVAGAAWLAPGPELLTLAEAVVLTGVVTEVVKVLASRPYPYMVRRRLEGSTQGWENGANYASFFSGHTAIPMAATLASGVLLDRAGVALGPRLLLLGAGSLLALLGGSLQVSAGNHYPSDVVAGALCGAALGAFAVLAHD